MGHKIIISGCSGGGKSSLLEILQSRGELVVEEPGRRIVMEELASKGSALPWIDMMAFARRAIAMSLQDLSHADMLTERVFFDRGLIDALVALEAVTGEQTKIDTAKARSFYPTVFIAPPWPEIYEIDEQRPHGFTEATKEYERLMEAYSRLGYQTVALPKFSIDDRADFVLSHLT